MTSYVMPSGTSVILRNASKARLERHWTRLQHPFAEGDSNVP
jgi:hypothetical protein